MGWTKILKPNFKHPFLEHVRVQSNVQKYPNQKTYHPLALVISKYINSDKTLQKMPILWNFWLKNAYYSYTVHVTLFHGMLLQKRKHFLESSLFSMALSQLEKRKHSVLSLVKIKTKLSKNFPFAMKFGIFGNSNTKQWYVFWFGYFWTLTRVSGTCRNGVLKGNLNKNFLYFFGHIWWFFKLEHTECAVKLRKVLFHLAYMHFLAECSYPKIKFRVHILPLVCTM